MKYINVSNALRAVLATAAMLSASAGAAPILSESSSRGAVGSGTAGVQAPLFSNMRLNGGQNSTVAFVSDDNSILIGHYARGPWSKAEFLRSWQNGGGSGNNGNGNGNGNNGNGNSGDNGNGGGGRGDFLPPVETVTTLPEPSTFALLALGLLALGAMRRRQKNR